MLQLVNCSAVNYKLSMRKMTTEAKFFRTDAQEVLRNKTREEFSNKIEFNNLM